MYSHLFTKALRFADGNKFQKLVSLILTFLTTLSLSLAAKAAPRGLISSSGTGGKVVYHTITKKLFSRFLQFYWLHYRQRRFRLPNIHNKPDLRPVSQVTILEIPSQ